MQPLDNYLARSAHIAEISDPTGNVPSARETARPPAILHIYVNVAVRDLVLPWINATLAKDEERACCRPSLWLSPVI